MVAGFKAVEGAGDFDFRGQGVEAAFLPRKLVASFVERAFRLIATAPFRSSSSLAQRLPSIIPRASAFKVL